MWDIWKWLEVSVCKFTLAFAQVLELAQAACHSSTATELEANEKQIWCFLSFGDLHHIIEHHQTLNTQNCWRSHFVVSLKALEALKFLKLFATNQLTGGAICW